MFFHKTPKAIRYFFPSFFWKIKDDTTGLYLTFDDGPVAGVTDWVLDVLKDFQISATFFCVGNNIKENPKLFSRILKEGHEVGNHTFNHLDGWASEKKVYIQNIKKCEEILPASQHLLFRPPHGRINLKAIKYIQSHYKVIMWDILAGDYRINSDPIISVKKTIQALENGSIVLFHDSKKAEKNMKVMLPIFLDHAINLGFHFRKFSWN